MFFLGAFSGNMLYVILVISYLAGCSAWVFRNVEDQPKEADPELSTSVYTLYENQLADSFKYFQANDIENSTEVLTAVTGISPPFLPYSEALYVPTILACETHFHGYVDFARPPPFPII